MAFKQPISPASQIQQLNFLLTISKKILMNIPVIVKQAQGIQKN